MKKALLALVSAIVCLILCIGPFWLLYLLGLGVHFPAPGGEDDYGRRAAYFAFLVCPAFMTVGVWIEFSSRSQLHLRFKMWCGALLGSLIAVGGLYFARATIEALSETMAATNAVLTFFGLWVLLVASGMYLGKRLGRKDD